MNAIFRETIDQIKTVVDAVWRLVQYAARYLAAAIVIRRLVEAFMTRHGVPGVSVAIAYKGRLVFRRGYGVADRLTGEPVRTDHLFRIASLSKSITAVAVFKLLEERRELRRPALRLDETVFGQNGILGLTYGTPPADSGIDQITVQHLLEHTSGWTNDPTDIMFDPAHINETQDQLISWMVANRPLAYNPPGATFHYLNFGYLVLGRVIEARSGMPYADYVRQAVLTPCGISDMYIAGDTLADRRPNEVHYYPGPGSPYDPYALRVNRMDAHGGWIASASDLVRFLVHVDGFPAPPDILTASSILTMVTPTTAKMPPKPPTPQNPWAPGIGDPVDYAKGWGVHSTVAAGQGNYWHEGNLEGTEAFFIRTPDPSYCLAVLANSRNDATEALRNHMIEDIRDRLWWIGIKPGVERGRHPDRVWPRGTPIT